MPPTSNCESELPELAGGPCLPPSAGGSSSARLSAPRLKRDRAPRREVTALETSLNILSPARPDIHSWRGGGRASLIARSLGRGCAPHAAAHEGLVLGSSPPGPAVVLGLRFVAHR